MLKKIFNLKVFLISSLFIMLFGSFVFADDFAFKYDSKYTVQQLLSRVPGYSYIETGDNNYSYIYFCKGKLDIKNDGKNGVLVGDSLCYQMRYDGDKNDKGEKLYHLYNIYKTGFAQVGGLFNVRGNEVLASSFSAFGKPANPFRLPPIASTLDFQTMITGVVQQMNLIIPVGILALCLVVLVPYLVQSLRKFV